MYHHRQESLDTVGFPNRCDDRRPRTRYCTVDRNSHSDNRHGNVYPYGLWHNTCRTRDRPTFDASGNGSPNANHYSNRTSWHTDRRGHSCTVRNTAPKKYRQCYHTHICHLAIPNRVGTVPEYRRQTRQCIPYSSQSMPPPRPSPTNKNRRLGTNPLYVISSRRL